jgi:predicted RNase H-like HicB family nuclease
MSETKRSGGAPKGGRRKKAKTEPVEEAMTESQQEENLESTSETEPTALAEAGESSAQAAEGTPQGGSFVPDERGEDETGGDHAREGDEDRGDEGEAPDRGEDAEDEDDRYNRLDSGGSALDDEDERVVREARLDRQGDRESKSGKYSDRSDRQPSEGQGGRRDPGEPRFRACDEYTLQVHYDKGGRSYQAGFAEFPEIRATGNQKESVIHEAESRLENHIQNLRRDGKPVPEALHARRYPERLEVRLSQNLYRRLDAQSRQEKVGLDQVVTELLTMALDKKAEPARGHEPRHERHSPPRHGGNQRERGGQHGQHRRHGRGNYQETMENRENFMEYVRNLEKGNFRKK